MRPLHRLATATVALAWVLFLPYEAVSYARLPAGDTGDAGDAGDAASAEPFGAECRVRVDDSDVTAHCHNPYPQVDHVRLHIECADWWDLDSDGPAVPAGPAQTVRLDGRCWNEVRSAWVSHARGS
ncbi:conserved exported protein of unknown function [Streptomyces ambofaciens ATCC 23877]|uniref:Uncharacterized protein n=1 Tax=Streptomyces ambofaciens (strain ATCC 23877 / 3486 / DSM 40053 / JCM 4204 / NBRC 12836 / NRRL B-2516) TaxID=278992 RepID=A0A0K2AP92_STRA7|nr:hypothetical protein [Streptomyces ambofaciens]AKZ54930.1 conserved exported protein of unknown function [Streptomyces ambofaciens ATCC 23877]